MRHLSHLVVGIYHWLSHLRPTMHYSLNLVFERESVHISQMYSRKAATKVQRRALGLAISKQLVVNNRRDPDMRTREPVH